MTTAVAKRGRAKRRKPTAQVDAPAVAAVQTVERDPLKINIGAGGIEVPGFTPLDIKGGVDIRALPFEDGTLKEIRASHVLEHIPNSGLLPTVRHWYAKLAPGGIVSIAVPDLFKIVQIMNNGNPQGLPLEAFIYGGQTDADDFHKCAFTREKLTQLLRQSGFQCLRRWRSTVKDCAALEPITLNIRATKPKIELPRVIFAMSVPALMHTDTVGCVETAIRQLQPGESIKAGGVFWTEAIDRMFTLVTGSDRFDWIVTIDYDSIFTSGDIVALLELAEQHGADALCALQIKRETEAEMLIQRYGPDGKLVPPTEAELRSPVLWASSGHFGLTVIRVSALRDLPRPWVLGTPDHEGKWEDGEYGKGKTDPDVYFWRHFTGSGRKLMCAMDVPIGHMQRVVSRPDQNLRGQHQFINDWNKTQLAPDWAW